MKSTDEMKVNFVLSFVAPVVRPALEDALSVGVRTHEEKMTLVMGYLTSKARSAIEHSTYFSGL